MKYPGSASKKGGGVWKSVKDDVFSFAYISEIFFMLKTKFKLRREAVCWGGGGEGEW